MFVQVFKAAGVNPHYCQCGGVQAKGLRYLDMAVGLLQYFNLTALWALSLNGGRAAAHGTRRFGCAPGLGLRETSVFLSVRWCAS